MCFNGVVVVSLMLGLLGVSPFSDHPLFPMVVCAALGGLGIAALILGGMGIDRLRRGNSN
jgi:hypothetical protein